MLLEIEIAVAQTDGSAVSSEVEGTAMHAELEAHMNNAFASECYDAPQETKEPKKCCKALTSKCLSCAEGVSEGAAMYSVTAASSAATAVERSRGLVGHAYFTGCG